MYKLADFGRNYGIDVAPVFRPVADKVKFIDTNIANDIDSLLKALKPVDLVLLGGGEDIHPQMYKHKNVASHLYTDKPSDRDIFESNIVDVARHLGKPMLGICRGAQMLCVKAGGWLIQHVDGHAGGNHDIYCPDFFGGDPLSVNSVHHQMMVPPNSSRHAQIVGYSNNRSSKFLFDVDTVQELRNIPTDRNPEIVFFPQLRALGIQGHPEFIRDPNQPFVQFTRRLLDHFFGFTFTH